MTTLIERMRQELVRRNYAATTIQSYIKAVEHFQQHIHTPLEDVGPMISGVITPILSAKESLPSTPSS